MRHKITLLTAAVVLAFMAGLTPRAFAQSYETEHASKIMLPSAGNNPAYTLTLVANGLTGNNILKFPDGNGSGGTSILTNDGTGVLSWTAPGLSTISPGLAGQFLVTNGSTAVQWLGLQINSDFTGNGITSNLAIAQTSAAGADIIAALTANAGNITNGTTGNAATATTATTATTASNVVTNTVSDNTSYYPALLSSATGAASTPVDVGGTGLSYNPSTGTLTATNFSGTSLTSTGTTTIDNSGSNAVNIGSGGTYTGIISIGDSATGDVSTTNIKGNVTFSGPVTLPPGSVTSSSLGLAPNDIYIGDATAGTADTAMVTQDVTLQNISTHVAQATVNGSHATTFAVTNAETVGTTLGVSGLATLNTATVTNNLLVSGGARVTGNDTTGGNAFVTGYQTITGGQQVGGNDTVLGTFYANGNSNIDASPSSGGTVTIGNSLSTNNIAGNTTFTGTVTLPAGSVTSSSLGLAKNDIFIGDATAGTADTAAVTQDVTLQNTSTHVAKATVNGSNAATFGVVNAETVGTTLGVSGLATLNTATVTNNLLVSGGARVAGNDTAGENLVLSGAGKQLSLQGTGTGVSTFQAGLQNTNTMNYILPLNSGAVNDVLTEDTISGNTVKLAWGTAAAAGVTSIGNATSDNTLTIAGTGSGPWTGATTAKINLANPNTWTGQQTFSNTTSAAAPLVVTNSDAPATGPAIGATISATGVGSGTNGNVALELNASGSTVSNAALYVQTGTVNIAGLNINSPVFTDGSRNLTSTGTVGVANGGTGAGSFTAYAPIVGGTTTTGALQSAASGIGTSGYVLTSTGGSSFPTWQPVSAAGSVLYNDSTTINNTAPVGITNYLFNVGYAGTTAKEAALGAKITSTNTAGGTGTAITNSAIGLTINTTATGTGAAQGIPVGLAITVSGDTNGPAIVLHNASTPVSGDSVHNIIESADNSLDIEQTGDLYGSSIIHMQNRTGANGAIFQTISSAAHDSTDLVDWGFIPGHGVQSNVRLEARHYLPTGGHAINQYLRSSANITATAPEEFQYFFGTTGSSPRYVLDIGENASMLERGSFAIGYGDTVAGDTAVGTPRERLDVHSPGTFWGGNSDAGYKGASNIILSDSGTSSSVAPWVGAMEFQGTKDGISAFRAGAQGSTHLTYILPTSGPSAAGQVLEDSAFAGAGTAATPDSIALEWVTPSSGSSGGVTYGIASPGQITTAVSATNYLYDIGYASTAVPQAALGALITSTNTATASTGPTAAQRAATGLTVNATSTGGTGGTITYGEATALAINAVGPSGGGAATGLSITTSGGTADTDISGTNNAWTITNTAQMTLGAGTTTGDLQVNTTTAGIGTTSTDGIVLDNPKAATSGTPIQYSPRLHLSGTAYESTGSHSETDGWTIEDQPVNGSTSTTSNLVIADETNGSSTESIDAVFSSGGMLTLGTASGETGTLALAPTSNTDYTEFQPSTATPAYTYVYLMPSQAGVPPTGEYLETGTPTLSSGTYTIPLTWNTAGSSTGVNFNVTTAQTAAIASNNYLFDVGYTNTAVDDSVVGAVITSTNTSNGGSSTSNHGATGLTVNATATSSTSFHGNSTAIFANATANTGGTATGINLNVTGGTDVDILGTAGWSVSSAGAATFAGVAGATTQIGNVAGFGAITIGNSGTGANSINILGGTTSSILIGGTAQTGAITLGSSSGTNIVNVGTGTGATTVNIANAGTGSANTVHIADGAVANTVTIGSTTGAATTNINAGTGLINLNAGVTGNLDSVGNANYSVGSTELAVVLDWASSNHLTLPTPTAATAGRILYVVNRGGTAGTSSSYQAILGSASTVIGANTSYIFMNDGGLWYQLK